MKFFALILKTAELPCFSTGLVSGGENLARVRLQLSRWVSSGKLIRIHKGLYTLAEPYRKTDANPFFIANRIKQPSYISLQSSLSWHGMIPEYTPVVTSITTERPADIETPLGRFKYHHIKPDLFNGYTMIKMKNGITAYMALPEKALTDLFYLTPGSDREEWIRGLRLQNYSSLNRELLYSFLQVINSPKTSRLQNMLDRILDKSEGVAL